MNTLYFVIAGLACWRLASLLANEDGAFHVFYHLRHYTRRLTVRNRFWRAFHLHQGVLCEWCNSVWFGIAIAAGWLYFGEAFIWLFCLALSAVAIPMKYVIQTLEQVREYYERLNSSMKGLDGYKVMTRNGVHSRGEGADELDYLMNEQEPMATA